MTFFIPSLGNNSDVSLNEPSDNDTLVYSQAAGKWQNGAASNNGIAQKYVAGRSYFPRQYFPNSGVTMAEGELLCVPFVVDSLQSFDALTCRMFTAGSAGALIRLGLYSDNNEDPDSLIVDAGTFDATILPTEHALPISVSLNPGLYWVAAAWQNSGTPPSTRAALIGGRGATPGPGVYGRRANDPNYWLPIMSGVSETLPATFVATGDWHTPARIGLRAS